MAVGKGKVRDDGTLQKLDVKKSDRILFTKYAGSEVELDGEEHLITSRPSLTPGEITEFRRSGWLRTESPLRRLW